MPQRETLHLALVGGGMFGSDVVLRTIEDLERCGLAPYLGGLGLDHRARTVAPLRFELQAIGTRTSQSAERLVRHYASRLPGSTVRPYAGETPWVDILKAHPIDILLVATPDHLHAAPVLAGLRAQAHVVVEKPLTLNLEEADEIQAEASRRNLIVGVDMHKRYDPCHRFLFRELVPRLGTLLYARAVLEEPLEVSTQTFQWTSRSNPFSYVGVHWTDLFGHYLGVEPLSLHAVGQKELLRRWSHNGGQADIDAFDALQVAVDYAGGLRVYYVNNWINPREFEGPVNQEMEIVGTRGKIEFDQQYRGLRATLSGVGSRTYNPHFTADVPREGAPGVPPAHIGYGKDSLIAIVERAAEVLLGHARADELAGTYPDVASARPSIGLLQAAAEVAERNWKALAAGQGTPVTARFSATGIDVVDPARGETTRLYAGRPWRG